MTLKHVIFCDQPFAVDIQRYSTLLCLRACLVISVAQQWSAFAVNVWVVSSCQRLAV